jgi:hypothetical protein
MLLNFKLNQTNEPLITNQPATVTALGKDKKMRVTYTFKNNTNSVWARNALVNHYEPQQGDEVLVSNNDAGEYFVLGVLQQVQARAVSVVSSGGAQACKQTHNGEEALQIKDAAGQLLFEYRPESGLGVIRMPEGDLALHAPHGNIHMLTGKSLVCSSLGPMVLESGSALELGVKKDGAKSSIRLRQDELGVSSASMNIKSANANVKIDRARYTGEQISGNVKRAKWIYEKLETVTQRLFERAKNVFRNTEELHQSRAGRMRTLVDKDYHVKAHDTDIQAQNIVKVDGEKIHLG